MRSLAPLIIITLITGCSYQKMEIEMPADNWKSFKKTIELQEIDTINLPLDKETSFWHYSMSVDNLNGKDELSFINTINNALYIYDLETELLEKKVTYSVEGPNGTGSLNLVGHKIINSDSVYIFNIFQGQIYLSNLEEKSLILTNSLITKLRV